MLWRSRRHDAGPAVSIQYMSDVHLERINYDYTIVNAAPILILAGDIGRFCDAEKYRGFLEKQCEQFEMVLLIAGNHEFYGTSREQGLLTAQSFVEDDAMHGKLHFLNRTRIDLPDSDITILGCTLHSHIAPDYTKLTNDFERIEGWRVRHHNEEHERDLTWLQSTITDLSHDEHPRRVIVATHYAPAFEKTTHPLYVNNAVSQCFSSHALQQISALPGSDAITHWIFGHTHWNTSFKCRGITVLSNQPCGEARNLTWWQKHTLHRPFNMVATIN